MLQIVKLLTIFAELIQALLKRRAQVKHEQDIEAVRKDPAGEFIDEFGGVPDKPAESPVPSGKAGAEVDKR